MWECAEDLKIDPIDFHPPRRALMTEKGNGKGYSGDVREIEKKMRRGRGGGGWIQKKGNLKMNKCVYKKSSLGVDSL